MLELIEAIFRSYVEDSLNTSERNLDIQYTPPRYFFKKGEGLKVLTPNQLLTRLPILLAQKKAANNSQY